MDSSKLSSLGYIELSLNDTGNYTITQIAEHANGCLDTISDTLRVIPEFLVYIPNAFSPNGDGLNDIWYPSVFVWKTYNLRIFDRWGEEIFQSNDPNEGWNGEAHRGGVLSPIGSYSYLINIKDQIQDNGNTRVKYLLCNKRLKVQVKPAQALFHRIASMQDFRSSP